MRIIPYQRNELEMLLHGTPPVSDGAKDSYYKKMKDLQASYDANLVIGGLHRIAYREYLHDKTPLTLIIDYIVPLRAVLGFNFHYLVTTEATKAIRSVIRANAIRIMGKKPPFVPVDLIENMPLDFLPYRLYQVGSIRPMKYIPFDQWEDTVKKEKSPWQGFRDFADPKLQRKKNPNKKPEKNKTARQRNKKPKQNKTNKGTNKR